jgi:colanic acid biosynthesis glycosyl transferase WcaI
MKIFIHTMYFLPEFGSAPILMNELAEDLAARGRDVEVVTTLPRPPHNRGYEGRLYVKEKRSGFRVKRFPTNFTAHHLGRLIAWTIYTLLTWVNLVSVRRGDVVFLRLPPLQLGITGILARRFRGARVVLNVQDIHPDLSIESGLLRNPFFIAAAQAFEKMIYRHMDEILVISEGFRRNLLAKGVLDEKIKILPNWVDTDFVSPRPKDNPVARRYGLADKFVLMYSGTISISSSVTLERILEAADRLRDDPGIRIAIVGEGLKKVDLTAKAKELGLPNVEFIPFQPYADLPDLLGAADVLLVPLDKEKSLLSVPSKLYNFMAAGRPILGLAHSDSEVFQIIRDTGCGTCAPPDDPSAIAAAIRALWADPLGRLAMGRNGRAYAEGTVSRRVVLDSFDRLLTKSACFQPGQGKNA